MNTFFKEVAKEKARKMLKSKKINESFDLKVNVLNGEHSYKLTVNINEISKHKSFSYNIEGIDNSYVETCELVSF
jgi:hypothetical protein